MASQFTLYTVGTPNGFPISIALEELGLQYKVHAISFAKKEQKEDWFLKINPNGRIPALVDHKHGDRAIFETVAILQYLTALYDPEGRISYKLETEPDLWTEQQSWLAWAQGGLGPMQGQSNHFFRYAPEKIEYGIKRYGDETKRLFDVIEQRLDGRDWLVGSHYSIADIKAFPWVRIAPWSGVELEPYPKIQAWIKRCMERPATAKGNAVPEPFDLEEKLANAEEISRKSREHFGFSKS